jgi:adenylate kinase
VPERTGIGPLRLVLLGPPGSGKGTQAEILSARLGVPAISTGDMLREAVAAGTGLGRRVHGIMTAGDLVDDATMAEVVRERLAQADAGRGFLLDGYPRTPGQAQTLEAILGDRRQRLDGVLLIDAPDEEVIHRIAGRGRELGREDDSEAVARERLRVYREKTRPLVGYYEGQGLLRTIDGDQPVGHVTADILAALGEAV